MTITDWLTTARAHLQTVGISSAQLDSQLLLSYALQKERTWLLAHDEEMLTDKDVRKADELLVRRMRREPLAYIRGWQEFYGRRFIVTPDVLVPRPESEQCIDFLKHHPPSGTLLDVGTGSGALGLTAAKEFPNLAVILSDVSPAALKVAKTNHAAIGSPPHVQFMQSDLLTSIHVRPHIIIANLPYVDRTWQRSLETDFEPSLALFAEDNGLALIRTLILQASEKLSSHGMLLLEADPRQFEKIKTFAATHNFEFKRSEGFVLEFWKN